MELIVHEITTVLGYVYQTVRPSKNTIVGAIRPHLYIHNVPSGTLKIQIFSNDGAFMSESSTVNISDITSSPEYHGYVTFYVDAFLMKDTNYFVDIVAGGGYTFSESAYCGVCNDYDLRKYEPVSAITHPRFAPLDLEIWSLSQK